MQKALTLLVDTMAVQLSPSAWGWLLYYYSNDMDRLQEIILNS